MIPLIVLTTLFIWKSCEKHCFLDICFLSRPSFHPSIHLSIHPSNQPTIQPSIHPSLPSSQKNCLRFLEILFVKLLPISVNSAHVSFLWIPHRCLVWPIVSLESRWQWKKSKLSLSVQNRKRLVISQRLRFVIIMKYYTWQQKCLLLKLLPSIVMVLCYALMVIMEQSIVVVVQSTTNHSNQQVVTIEVKVWAL